MTLAEPTVLEGETHVATIRLSQPLAQVERVFVSTADRTASFGRDYFRMMSEQLVFLPGETAKTVSIRTLRDSATEGVETFRITAAAVNPRLRAGFTDARIGDYTPPPLMNVSGVSVLEGGSGTTPATFTITLSARYPKEVSVNYVTRDGSATVADNDYQATTGRITFAPGETSKTVAVNVVGDRKLEADETFTLVLSAPTNATIRQTTATGIIRNDESDQPGYQITLEFLTSAAGEVPQSIRVLAAEAAARWSRVIVGDLPSVSDANGFIDDIVFRVQMGLLGGAPSGPGGTLANAGPVSFRDGGSGLPYEAITGIDPADAATQTAADRAFLLDVLVHEIGHGLGFTPGSTVFSRYIDQTAAVFTGPNALREYNSIFGVTAAGVPLQPVVLAHWNETLFGNEIMSPQIAGSGNPLSRVTVGALQDMGYQVNYAAADTYRPNRTPVTTPATGRPPASQLPVSRPPATPPPTTRPPATTRPNLRPIGTTSPTLKPSTQAIAQLPSSVSGGQRAADRPGLPSAALATLTDGSATDAMGVSRKAVSARMFANLLSR